MDVNQFATVSHPERFVVGWRSFYEEMIDRSNAMRRNWPGDIHLAYGRDPAQIVNVFIPTAGTTTSTLVGIVHGGGWREGHPDIYDCLAEPWLEQGAVAVCIGYRYLPAADMLDSTRDVYDALAFAVARVARATDIERVIVVGHSAGAAMLASILTHPSVFPMEPLGLVTGLLGVSGVYDMMHLRSRPTPSAIEAARWTPINPVTPESTRVTRIFLGFGFPERNLADGRPDHFQREATAFQTSLHGIGAAHCDLISLPGRDHAGTALALAEPDPALAVCIHKLLRGS